MVQPILRGLGQLGRTARHSILRSGLGSTLQCVLSEASSRPGYSNSAVFPGHLSLSHICLPFPTSTLLYRCLVSGAEKSILLENYKVKFVLLKTWTCMHTSAINRRRILNISKIELLLQTDWCLGF